MKKILRVFFAILFLPVCAQADIKYFYSDGTIEDGNNWMNVYIYDTLPNHTTVTMTGGSVNDSMGVFDAATFNMSGGNVGGLNASNFSSVNISGGTVTSFMLYDNASATLSGNGNIWRVSANGPNVFSMTAGTITYLGATSNAILNLRGGTITDSLGTYSSATINIFGYNLIKTSTGGTYGTGQVTGFWQNNLPFVINLGGPETYSVINLILIPEPATLLLFGIGTFLVRKLDL